MAKRELYLSLGSNLGDREGFITKAIVALEEFLKMPAACSRILEYPSWGFCSNDFLNCVVRFDVPVCGVDTELFLTALLRQIKVVEKAFGRDCKVEFNADGTRIYHDRPIDIDILFYGNERVDSDILKVPHPLAGERNFVLEPLKDVASNIEMINFADSNI